MGFLSTSISVTQYTVEGKINEPVIESVANGLKSNSIQDLDSESKEINIGWTSFENFFNPDFSGSSFVIGNYIIFSLRIDKKSIPSKIFQKYYNSEMLRKLSETGREYLSREEKKELREHITNLLLLRIPVTPNVYDILWDYEQKKLFFFSTLKLANEELETIFYKSFKLTLIRLFPYTNADLMMNLSDADKDVLNKLSQTSFQI